MGLPHFCEIGPSQFHCLVITRKAEYENWAQVNWELESDLNRARPPHPAPPPSPQKEK